MKKRSELFCSFLVASLLLMVTPGKSQTISIDVMSDAPQPVANFDGHNASFFNEVFHCDLNGGFNIYGYTYIHQISPKLLRFPGGKLSQFAHLMQGPGYGLDSIEIVANFSGTELTEWLARLANQDTLTCNYINAFHEFVAANNDPDLKVLYVLNINTGTVQENLDAITHLINNGVNIVGVEVGNEHYRDELLYPTVTDYINHSLPYVNAIKAAHPSLRIGWVAAPPLTANQLIFSSTTKSHFHQWNTQLAQHTDSSYVDAFISHIYHNSYFFQCSQLYAADYDNSNLFSLNNTFELGSELFDDYLMDSIPLILNEYQNYFGNNKKLWITEWNMAKPSDLFGNTILDASFTMRFTNQFHRLNANYNNMVEYLCRQKLAGPFFNSQNTISPKSSLDDIATPYVKRTSYYPYLLFNRLYDEDFKVLPTTVATTGLTAPFYAQAYYEGVSNEVLMCLVNENQANLTLNLSDLNFTYAGNTQNYDINTPIQLRYIQGDNLYSSAGVTKYFFENVNYSNNFKPPFEITDVEEVTWSQSATSVTIPSYSVAVLRFRADHIVSTEELVAEESAPFEVYPNPQSSGATVTLKKANPAPGVVRIYDYLGRHCVEAQLTQGHQSTLEVSTLKPGCYAIVLEQGTVRSSQPLVITE